jgi:hypothetical protein
MDLLGGFFLFTFLVLSSSWGSVYILRRSRLRRQRPTPPRREDPHDPKDHVEQRKRIRHQASHAAHASDGTEHAGTAVRAPADGGRCEQVAEHGVHGEQDADQGRQHQWEETVAQHAGGAREGQRRGEVAGQRRARRRCARWRLVVRVVVRRVRGVRRGRAGVEGGGHQAQDQMERYGAEDRDAIDVSVKHLAGEKEESSI